MPARRLASELLPMEKMYRPYRERSSTNQEMRNRAIRIRAGTGMPAMVP